MRYNDFIKRVDGFVIDRLPTRFFVTKALWAEVLPLLISKRAYLSVTMQSYGRISEFLSDEHNSVIFNWENEVLSEYLKPGPAKVLVAACGAGREMKFLAESGYQVAGFDPFEEYITKVKETISPQKLICAEIADFNDFACGLESLEDVAPYDFGIIGWGGLVYLTDKAEQLATLRKFREMIKGFMLISWIPRPQMSGTRQKINIKLSGLRKLIRKQKIHYDTHLGVIHEFDEAEIKTLAKDSGFEIVKLENTLTRSFAVLK